MQLLKYSYKFVFRKDSLNDALQDDDDQPLVEGVVLEHVEQHLHLHLQLRSGLPPPTAGLSGVAVPGDGGEGQVRDLHP